MSAAASCLELAIFSALEIAFAKKILGVVGKENEEEALFLCYLFAASLEGHLCVEKREKLFPRPSFLFDRPSYEEIKELESSLEEKILAGMQKISALKDSASSFSESICIEQSRIYLQKNHYFETEIAKGVSRLLEAKPKDLFVIEKLQEILEERVSGGYLLTGQRESIEKCLDHSLSLIVGGPGTGKTYTAAEMIALFSAVFDRTKKQKFRVALAAPTGRAADHLKQAIEKRVGTLEHLECVFLTLHALLKIREGRARPLVQKLLMNDLIIVDEASMIDPRLMACLLKATSSSSRLVLMGDAKQLPAVEGGSIFADMAEKKSWNLRSFSTFLQRAVRFENEKIVKFSEWILEGNYIDAMKEEEGGVSFHFLEEEKKMQENFLDLGKSFFSPPFTGKVEVGKCFQFLQNFRLLSPLRNSSLGVDAINQMFFQKLLKSLSLGQEAALPILMTRNDPEKKFSNGTPGVIVFTFRGEKNPFRPTDPVYFWDANENKPFSLPLCALGLYEYGFCLSVHKSQGSEFSEVRLLLPPGSERFGKEMFYTAATRAKKNLLVIGRRKTIEELFKRESLKSSGLLKKLQECEKT
jgi:exodeoxyribonuclease V alpha subunit